MSELSKGSIGSALADAYPDTDPSVVDGISSVVWDLVVRCTERNTTEYRGGTPKSFRVVRVPDYRDQYLEALEAEEERQATCPHENTSQDVSGDWPDYAVGVFCRDCGLFLGVEYG